MRQPVVVSAADDNELSRAELDAIADAVFLRVESHVTLPKRLFDIEEAAKYLGLSAYALRHKAGYEIPVVRIDAKLRFDRRDLDRYIDRAKREGGVETADRAHTQGKP
jgi:Helix-turn-helix domain